MPTAREQFKFLFLSGMKQKAKKLGVDLKPYYIDQARFYNEACFEWELYTPISLPPQSPQLTLINQPHQKEDDQSIIPAPQSAAVNLPFVQPEPSDYTHADLSALEDKIMVEVQTKLDALKAQIDHEEVGVADKVVTRMNEISTSITNSLITLQSENNT